MSSTRKTQGSASTPKSPSRKSSAERSGGQRSSTRGRASAPQVPEGAAEAKAAGRKPRKTTKKKTAAQAGKKATKKTAAKRTKKTAAKPATTKKTPRTRKKTAASSSATAPKRTARRSTELDAKTLATFKGQLEDELAELRRAQEEMEEGSSDGTQSEVTGEVGIDEDFADAGTATFDRERDFSIHNNLLDLIDQVTRALGRIEDGTYGACERCGRPIDRARLKARPRTLLCMDCKRREERAR